MKTYDPSQGILTIGGAIMAGWNGVTTEYDEDEWAFTPGTQGELTRTKNLSKLGTITVIFPQTHSNNMLMSGFQTAGSLIVCAFMDKSGLSLATMGKGTVVKQATSEFAKESGEREWQIKGNIEAMIVGGNNES